MSETERGKNLLKEEKEGNYLIPQFRFLICKEKKIETKLQELRCEARDDDAIRFAPLQKTKRDVQNRFGCRRPARP